MDMFNGRAILVTGGTGSFGKAFIEYMYKHHNDCEIVAFARDWHKLNDIKHLCTCVIGDVRDKERLIEVMGMYDISYVVHAGAIKDVTFCEDNPTECLKTNIIGTQNVIDACICNAVNKCILISTDKAVLPVNTYGTSKKMAEKLWINSNCDMHSKFSVCRYGNVIGSSGSVLPLYKKLVDGGEKLLPVTDIRCTRFWYPMEDAIKFVIDSFLCMVGGEMFIPKIPSIKITDLVKAFGCGYKVIGLREGEKIHETMIPYDEISGKDSYNSWNNEHYLTVNEIKESIDLWNSQR